ncbi:hypothetical protein [Streptomyces sp. SID3343]|uniref:hypothetical protein n=1 Tax=Streptomyces sp. SID3343 TaxID=2690260 RepID=UPI00136AB9CF|nr:hypothetical protein [Streptomyces sp. SID3343]MYW05833.1 hypothetical protein [Streptomyces sp. SID3343]
MIGRRLPEERPRVAPVGYKIATLLLSAGGDRAGFAGVSIGRGQTYGVEDDARCAYGRRHASPAPRCDCGFYCLGSEAEARDLLCVTEYRFAALLTVDVLGSYIRYQRGLRYSRQRVTAVRVGACACGNPAELLVDAGAGMTGRRALTGCCLSCAAGRIGLSFGAYARLAGVPVTADASPYVLGERDVVPRLVAEVTLLQARLDRCQEQLGRLLGSDP